MPLDVIVPEWPAPPSVGALMTTRPGGVSVGPYASLNLGDHVGDAPDAVARNRHRLSARIPAAPLWLSQVHGVGVVDAAHARQGETADAVVCRARGVACTIMTADCLPVLLCDRAGSVVAAAHAGWRGLCDGVLENTLASMAVAPGEVMVWLGAAIGPEAFEVGAEVKAAFCARDGGAELAFARGPVAGKWLANLYVLARRRLERAGVASVHGGHWCTYTDSARFFSYRRDGVTGRMAALVWLA